MYHHTPLQCISSCLDTPGVCRKCVDLLSGSAFSFRGCSTYRVFLTSSRLVLRCCYSQLSLDLLKITKEVEGGKIEARWRVRGCPRLRWKMQKR